MSLHVINRKMECLLYAGCCLFCCIATSDTSHTNQKYHQSGVLPLAKEMIGDKPDHPELYFTASDERSSNL